MRLKLVLLLTVISIIITILNKNYLLSEYYGYIAQKEANIYLSHSKYDKDKYIINLNAAENYSIKALTLNRRNIDARNLYFTIVKYKYLYDPEKRIEELNKNADLIEDKALLRYKIAMIYLLFEDNKGYDILINLNNSENTDTDMKHNISCILYPYYYERKEIDAYNQMLKQCNRKD